LVNVDIRASLHVKVITGVILPTDAAHAWGRGSVQGSLFLT
jgi:hypothetical protein